MKSLVFIIKIIYDEKLEDAIAGKEVEVLSLSLILRNKLNQLLKNNEFPYGILISVPQGVY